MYSSLVTNSVTRGDGSIYVTGIRSCKYGVPARAGSSLVSCFAREREPKKIKKFVVTVTMGGSVLLSFFSLCVFFLSRVVMKETELICVQLLWRYTGFDVFC